MYLYFNSHVLRSSCSFLQEIQISYFKNWLFTWYPTVTVDYMHIMYFCFFISQFGANGNLTINGNRYMHFKATYIVSIIPDCTVDHVGCWFCNVVC